MPINIISSCCRGMAVTNNFLIAMTTESPNFVRHHRRPANLNLNDFYVNTRRMDWLRSGWNRQSSFKFASRNDVALTTIDLHYPRESQLSINRDIAHVYW